MSAYRKSGFTLDFESPEFIQDPYPVYERLRQESPVYKSQQGDWYLTDYDDVKQLFSDRRMVKQILGRIACFIYNDRESNEFEDMIARWMLFSDPPAHTKIRRIVNPSFIPKIVDGLKETIELIVNRQIDFIREKKEFDLVGDYAYPITIRVICHILGVPEKDHTLFEPWAMEITSALDTGDEKATHHAGYVVREMRAYFSNLFDNNQQDQADGLTAQWVAHRKDKTVLSDDEFLANASFLLWAGHEITKNLIANGMLALLGAHDQFNKLKLQPRLIDSAIEELLCFESPIQKLGRWTSEEVEFSGVAIPKGQFVVGLLGAANRDPGVF